MYTLQYRRWLKGEDTNTPADDEHSHTDELQEVPDEFLSDILHDML